MAPSPDLPVVTVHSVAEAYLYLMVRPCLDCGRGPLKQRGDLTRTAAARGGWLLPAACGACGHRVELAFDIQPPPTREQARSDTINPTAERSQAIDLLGWITLFQTILAESQKQTDRQLARQLAWESAQCLDEALKFYDGDQELPAADAFFSDAARDRFRAHPEYFARSKWRERRLLLPDGRTRDAAAPRPRRRWWRFW